MVGMVPIDRLMASPESLTRSSSISSSSQSNLSDTSPRVIQPRPLQRPYYDLHAFEHTGAAFRGSYSRCLNSEGSPSDHWVEMNMSHPVLRDPSHSDGSPPYVPQPFRILASTNDEYQKPSGRKYQLFPAERWLDQICFRRLPRTKLGPIIISSQPSCRIQVLWSNL